MKHRFPILLKVAILGIGVSILTSAAAITVSYFNQERQGEKALLNNIDYTLNAVDEVFTDEESTNTPIYVNYLHQIRTYVEDIYKTDTDKKTPEDFETFEAFCQYYAGKYSWIYQRDPRMGFISPDEADFKVAYYSILNLINNYQMSSAGQSVFLAYTTDDNDLVFLMDSRMDNSERRPEDYFHVPGYSYRITASDYYPDAGNAKHYNCTLDGYNTRLTHIYDLNIVGDGGKPLLTLYIQYDLTGVHEEALDNFKKELLIIGLSALLLIAIYTLFSYLLFVKNINKLSNVSGEIRNRLENKNMNEIVEINVKSNDEMRILADSMIEMERAIINYVDIIHKETEERERTNAELSVASKIQLDSLPQNKLEDQNVSLRSYIKTAKEVGGDFYDYFYLDDHRLAFLVSDVSGKGIPASLFMMKGKELIKSAVSSYISLEDAVNAVNNMLAKNNKELLFITSFIGVIDFNKNEIRYINAGHEKPYIVSKGNLIKLDGESNIMLGVEEGFKFKEESRRFSKGDYLFMFTDGLNESINDKNEEFGYPRVEQNLKDTIGMHLDDIILKMNKSLDDFIGDKEQFDDITMLFIKNKDNNLKLHYETKDYQIITDIVDKFNDAFAFLSMEVKSSVGIIVDELINNYISYDPREDLVIDFETCVIKDKLHMKIITNGSDYDPFLNHKDKYLTKENENPELGGFGIKIVKDLVNSYKYEYIDEHTVITLVKNI